MGVVYYIRNKINNKYYIGLDNTGGQKRWKAHINSSRRYNKKINKGILLIEKKMAQYGVNNFEYAEIYFSNDFEKLRIKEQEFIKKYNSFVGNGYNKTLGGDGCLGFKFSEESKKKLSELRTGEKHPLYGTKRSDSVKKKISKKNKGKTAWNKGLTETDERVAKYVNKIRGKRSKENNPNFKYKIDKEELFNYYIIQDHKVKNTANHFKCAVAIIYRRLREYKIPLVRKINKEELYNYYIVQNFSLKEMVSHFKCSLSTISGRIKEYGIFKKLRNLEKKNNK